MIRKHELTTGTLIRLMIGASTLLGILPFALYIYIFNNGLSRNSTEWANFGSFYGGLLGPMFSLLTLNIVLVTFQQQLYENKQSKKQKKEEEFRNVFFNLLSLLVDTKNNFTLLFANNTRKTGIEVEYYAMETAIWIIQNDQHEHYGQQLIKYKENKSKRLLNSLVEFRESFNECYIIMTQLQPFIRQINEIINIINSNNDIENKEGYISILMSQISIDEFLLIMYYGYDLVNEEMRKILFYEIFEKRNMGVRKEKDLREIRIMLENLILVGNINTLIENDNNL